LSINLQGIELKYTKTYISNIAGLLLFSFIFLFTLPDISYARDKQTIGWIEKVALDNNRLQLKAKIDTGATTSSIHAEVLKKFKRGGQKWVRFKLRNKTGQSIVVEKKVVRMVKIKRKLALSLKRPVVLLGVCLGKVYREEEVNLSNRGNFVYEMLIGRNYLKDYFLVDSSRTFTVKPRCK
jgi:hypothetical protein